MTSRGQRLKSAGLDAPLSTRELARIYAQRTGKTVPDLNPTSQRLVAPVLIGRRAEVEAIGERLANGIRLVLPVAPRTKKNGTTLGIRQSPAYVRYRNRVIELVAPLVVHLALPLEDVPYNVAAIYYVDKPGEQADKVGLDQGLYDALENAGVVSNDWFFRTADGTRVVFGDEKPRVDLTITRIRT